MKTTLMKTTLTPMGSLRSGMSAPSAGAASLHGTAVPSAVVGLRADVAAGAFGIAVPGPPRGAPV